MKHAHSAAATTPALLPGLRYYLYLTAFTTGAVIMVVEILGAKMLSPFVGTSHFVWTAQIAVTLVALACGYYAGGWLADRARRLDGIYWAIAAAGTYLGISIKLVEPVAFGCLEFNLAVGTLLASMVLFFVPLALLAMTGPFLIRFVTASLSAVGGSVGRLTAIGTLGSFAGTMLIGYVMIPLLANPPAMFATALALLVVSAAYFLFTPRRGAMSLPLLAGVTVGILTLPELLGPPRHTRMVERFRGNSHFGQLLVLDRPDGSCRYYLNDNLIQNTYAPETRQSVSTFTYMLSGLARAYTTNLHDVLCIGLGVGIVPSEFAREGARVDVVEINPAVVPVARRFFDFDPGRVSLYLGDGRHYLNRCSRQYDTVILDAFLGDSSPSHLMTREAFAAIRRVLRPGGTLVINSFADATPGQDFFAASLGKTLRAVFPGVRLHSNSDGAIFFVATDRPHPEFVRPPDFSQVHPDVRLPTERAFNNRLEVPSEHGLVLTDDYNPVEFYDAHHRENIRRELARAARFL